MCCLDPIIVRQQDEKGNAADRASSVYVADAELERARLGDVKDLFAGIASVSVGGGIPIAQKIFVNGVDMLNLAIQVDGVSQNNRIFHHLSANAFDPGLMKSVRVDPGVAPADAGPRALAGRVVMETVDAEDILKDGQNLGGIARLGYSSNGETAQGSLTLTGRSGGFEVLGYAKRATGENYSDGDGNEMTGTAANMSVGLLKFAYESDEGHRVELSGQQIQDNEIRNFQPNFGASSRGIYAYDTTRKIYSLRYENVNNTGLWDPSATLGYSATDVDRPTDPWAGSTFSTSSTYSLVLQNEFHLSVDNSITAGIDFQNRKTEVSGSWVVPGTASEKSDNIGIFTQARLEPTDRLSISGGLRYDWQDFTGYRWLSTEQIQQSSHSGASGNLSLVYDITDEFSVRAGYSNVFGGVDLGDSFEFWNTRDYSSLRPSRAKNIILGADWTPGAWALSAEVFQTKFDDARDDVSGRVTLVDFESKGANLGATYGWGGGFARLTYSYSKAKVNGQASSNYDLRDFGAPLGHVLALEVQQELPYYDMLIGGSLEAAASYDPQGSYAGQAIPGYEVVNLFAEYSPPALKGATIRGSINNLFDETYADRATYGGEFTGFATMNEPGRSFVIEAVMKF
ncbi:TonB-dependent siderophore receptor [Phaeobacter sp.]|uniref:TonB-dependent receptor plug domain-containing protein n=1 Tax=Phaeobacter sp. TaxID=1902409 RepID=UPI0025EE1132|nr:TonB-dependent receptor [Phaeobacter sp.]